MWVGSLERSLPGMTLMPGDTPAVTLLLVDDLERRGLVGHANAGMGT